MGLVVLVVLSALLGFVFSLLSALLGLVFSLLLRRSGVLALAAGLLYGLGVWAALQFFLLPLLFPLVSDKGFPPMW